MSTFTQKNALSVPIPAGTSHVQKLALGGLNNTLSDVLLMTDGLGDFSLNGAIGVMIGATTTPPTWAASTAYVAGQIVISSSVRYVCINDVNSTTAPASDTTNWASLATSYIDFFCDNIKVNGVALAGLASAATTFAVGTNLTVGGTAVITGTLSAAATTLASLGVTGAATVGTTLIVTGATQSIGALTLGDGTSAAGSLIIRSATGSATIASLAGATLTLGDGATQAGALVVKSAAATVGGISGAGAVTGVSLAISTTALTVTNAGVMGVGGAITGATTLTLTAPAGPVLIVTTGTSCTAGTTAGTAWTTGAPVLASAQLAMLVSIGGVIYRIPLWANA